MTFGIFVTSASHAAQAAALASASSISCSRARNRSSDSSFASTSCTSECGFCAAACTEAAAPAATNAAEAAGTSTPLPRRRAASAGGMSVARCSSGHTPVSYQSRRSPTRPRSLWLNGPCTCR
eukprot:361885-Chlamydomonas_euryale.AAC.18